MTERFRQTQSHFISRKHFVLPLTYLVETYFFKLLKIEIMAAVEGCKNRMVVLREDIIERSCELLGLENECEIEKKIRSDFRMKIMEDGLPNRLNRICISRCRASEIIPILEKHGYEFHLAKSRDACDSGYVEVFWEFTKKV